MSDSLPLLIIYTVVGICIPCYSTDGSTSPRSHTEGEARQAGNMEVRE
jgi:hypothetical protein